MPAGSTPAGSTWVSLLSPWSASPPPPHRRPCRCRPGRRPPGRPGSRCCRPGRRHRPAGCSSWWSCPRRAASSLGTSRVTRPYVGPRRPRPCPASLPQRGGVMPPGRAAAAAHDTGAVTRATLEKDPAEVAAMFDEVAARYDLTNAVLSLGQDRSWRRAVADRAGPACRASGCSTSRPAPPPAAPPSRAPAPTSSAATSASGMLRVGRPGRARGRRPGRGRRAAAALRRRRVRRGHDLLRAAQHRGHRRRARRAAPRHPARRPAGGLRVQPPTWAPFRTVYVEYLMRLLPDRRDPGQQRPGGLRLPGRVDPRLAASRRRSPARLQRAGWADVAWRDLTGGIVALHRGTRPA